MRSEDTQKFLIFRNNLLLRDYSLNVDEILENIRKELLKNFISNESSRALLTNVDRTGESRIDLSFSVKRLKGLLDINDFQFRISDLNVLMFGTKEGNCKKQLFFEYRKD
jgi:hypothetical protein